MANNRTLLGRVGSWLHGDDIRERAEQKAAQLFPYDSSYRIAASQWSTPTPNGDSVYYGGSVDYAVEAADLIDNSAVCACLLWIMRTFPEARIRVMKRGKGAKPTEVENHPLTRMMTRPNPYYSGRLLLQPSSISYNWRGETYMRKIRNGQGQLIQLYYEPHWTCRPVRASADDFISYYQLYRNNKWMDVALEDIVHIRYGLDPENPMHGLSPLASALREVFTDNAAGRYASSVMRKLGVLGAIVTPKDADTEIGDPVRLKAQLQAISTGDERGSYGVFSTPLDFNYPPNDPSKMDTRANRKITEERISGLLGVPAIVAGLGAGLDRSTFANMSEAREMAYESNIIPTQSLWADELNTQLLNELGDPDTEFVDWDYSAVRVLQDDENKKAARLTMLYAGGLVKRSEARGDLNYPIEPDDEQYKPSGGGAFGAPADTTQPQDATAVDAIAKMLLLPAGAEMKALPKPAQNLAGRMAADVEAEIARMYAEAVGKVSG